MLVKNMNSIKSLQIVAYAMASINNQNLIKAQS